MATADDVMRMEEQRDVDGLIRLLQSDDVPEVRALAALALGRLGDPKARVVLQNALMSGDPQVMGAASSAIGQLEASIAMGIPSTTATPTPTGTPIIMQEQQPEDPTREKQSGCKGKLWKMIMWIGILMLISGCLTIGLVVLTSGSSAVDWPPILTFTVISIGLGSLLIFVSTRPIEAKVSSQGEETHDATQMND